MASPEADDLGGLGSGGPDEQVDLDGDNDSEEMLDEDAEDQSEEEALEEYDSPPRLGYEDKGGGVSDGAENIDSNDGPHEDDSPINDEGKINEPKNEDDIEKHAELLALPPHGSEIFVGGLPRDITEDDLRELCEPFGEIFEVRLMKDKDRNENKGFAFVAFHTKEMAQLAIGDIHNKEFKGKTLRCSLSQVKHRLFMGNIPKSLTDEEMRKVIEETGPGVENIELLKDPQNPSRNRGFAFIEYYNHACADYSRQKMSSSEFKLEGITPTVTWADPKSSPNPAATAQVKALYVKNIPENTTPDQLKEIFQVHGEVTKVVLPPGKSGNNKRDFGFIHFAERSSALKAVKESEKYEIDGHQLDVSLAKSQGEKKFDPSFNFHKGGAPGYMPYPGYGFVGDPYGAVGSGFGAGFGQPLIYGRGPMPPGMQMVPMVLPDGRIGYVLQQPGMQAPHPRGRGGRNDRAGGSSGGPGRNGSGEGYRGRRYRPY